MPTLGSSAYDRYAAAAKRAKDKARAQRHTEKQAEQDRAARRAKGWPA